MYPMLNIAIRAARMAGNLIVKYYETIHQTIKKGPINIDNEVESLIIKIIYKFYPQHTVIGKGCGELTGEDRNVQWIINPLGGTTNFMKRFPHFAVSIAIRIKGCTEVAVTYDPMRNELFTATRGNGAQLNNYRLRSSYTRDLDRTSLATGLSLTKRKYYVFYINMLNKLPLEQGTLRCTGSVVLDLAYVAAGRLDGFFEIGLKPWDYAGGVLLVHEAGGLVTDFTGCNNYLFSGNIIAGNPNVVKSMLSLCSTIKFT